MSEETSTLTPSQKHDLGGGLELWKVSLDQIHEQDVNARAMNEQAFLQLSRTIKKTGRLESTPLAALKEGRLELISGHHRVRAAKKAGMEEIWVMVDITGIDRDHLKAKQLAHNSIQGEDNPDIVAQIFADIASAEARMEAFIEPDLGLLNTDVRLTSRDLDITFNTRVVSLMFLDAQASLFKEALDQLTGEETDVYVAAREEYDILIDTVGKVSEAYEIRSTPTIFAKMSEIVLEHIAAEQAKAFEDAKIAKSEEK